MLGHMALLFQNREEAASMLAKKLERFRKDNPLVLAIPRGAVPMGKVIADYLHCDLDVVLVGKLGFPGNPELALGSISEFGDIFLGRHGHMDVPDAYIKDAAQQKLEILRKRRATYTSIRSAFDPSGRTVIIVDDGIATGSTMLAAIRSVRSKHPKKLIAAAPVSADDSIATVQNEADELVLLDAPHNFHAVGQFYVDFPQVSDDQVVQLLRSSTTQHAR